MTMRHVIRPSTRAIAVLAVTLLVACVPPAAQPHTVAASPCADPSYVQLRQQHPDSLSAREWQRLQTLDGQCAVRADQGPPRNDSRSQRHGAGHLMGAGIATVMMVAMMVSMW